MQKIKNIAYLFVALLILSSCGEYNRVLNRGTVEEQYKMAVKLYETQKYSKALRLFEKITPFFVGKPQMERIQYMVANSNFNKKDYSSAGYYFDRFATNYPKSSKKEEADFMSALSYYKSSPAYSLDKTDTEKAIKAFQTFIDNYPNSKRIEEANKYYKDLLYKLEKKSFEIAKGYYETAGYDSRNYKASIAAFNNLLSDYLGTSFKEEALFYILKASHDFAVKSTQRRKPKRIKSAIKAYDKLKRNFPKSKFLEDANKMLETLQKEEQQLVKINYGL
ncbi:MAG: outer membrane protein assembly factor BamD [Tenacibaculum sp.]|nr:outer membrane protein assembly factor BamD [Tenacibaculum sp.]